MLRPPRLRLQRRYFLLTGLLALAVLLFTLLPVLSRHGLTVPAPGALRLSGVNLRPYTAEQVEGVWVARQGDGTYTALLDWDPVSRRSLWHRAEFLRGPFGLQTYALDGHCAFGSCQGDLCRVELLQTEPDVLYVWPGRPVSGQCPAALRKSATTET